MRTGIEEGFRVLDFGRSSPDAGTFEAKRQWKAEAHQLYWHYHPDTAEPGQDLQRLVWATRVWKRLPVSVVDRLGPRVRGGLPN
jgi:hypothetical protein